MDNRSRLLTEAMRLFAARGYDAVGVQEIVEAAEVTKPTLYHYFGNKLGLLDSLMEQRGAALMADLRVTSAYQGDLPLTLNRVMTAYFRHARRDPEFQRFRMAQWLAPPESDAGQQVANQLKEERGLLEAMFAAAEQDHGNMRGKSRLFTVSLQGLVYAHIRDYLRGGQELDEELTFLALRQFMYGIYT